MNDQINGKKKNGMGSHQSSRMVSDEHLTPKEILYSLGHFDLDPCAPCIRPWPMATIHYTVEDDGLSKEWHGRVWCNPPYGSEVSKWLKKLYKHNDGIALIFARTETNMFFDWVWRGALSTRDKVLQKTLSLESPFLWRSSQHRDRCLCLFS